MKKHAYLIRAHHRPDCLQDLLNALDDERNDIYIHIDKKSRKNMPPELFSVNKARLTFVRSVNVNWAGFSQVECILIMLSAALNDGPHSYYHLVSGVTYPLMSQDEIYSFFEENAGKEYIGIDDSKDWSYRVIYYWPFSEAGQIPYRSLIARAQRAFLSLQKRCGINLFIKYNMEFHKGLAYWSITEKMADYIMSHGNLIRRMFGHSYIADESFMQTLAYASPYKDNITENSSMLTTWDIEKKYRRPGHQFLLKDIQYIMESDSPFALKLDGNDGELLRNIIRNNKWKQ